MNKLFYSLSFILLLAISACNKNNETPPSSLDANSVSAPTCTPAYAFIDVGSIQPIYEEECPSCDYSFEVTNGATIVAESEYYNSATIRAGTQNFQIKVKITYEGGETNTVIKDVIVESQDAIAKLHEIDPDTYFTCMGGFEFNGSGYAFCKTLNDYRIMKYYPSTDKWQALKVVNGYFGPTRISRPHLMNTDEFYFTDMQGFFHRYDFSANTFNSLGAVPCSTAVINYCYNGKYYSGAGSYSDSIYEYDPLTTNWNASYKIDAGITGGVVKYCYPMANKAYIFLNTGGLFVLDYASQTFSAITGAGFDYYTSVIFELYGNLHLITGGSHTIINTTTNAVTPYSANNSNSCGTTLNNFSSTFSQYTFFGVGNKGIAIDDDGEVYHYNPNY